jgi:hypothetical protein
MYPSLVPKPKAVQVSLINEPVEEPPRESATEHALRIWFKQNPVECESESAG